MLRLSFDLRSQIAKRKIERMFEIFHGSTDKTSCF